MLTLDHRHVEKGFDPRAALVEAVPFAQNAGKFMRELMEEKASEGQEGFGMVIRIS